MAFQNPVFIKSKKFVDALGKALHGKGIAPLDNAFDIVKKG